MKGPTLSALTPQGFNVLPWDYVALVNLITVLHIDFNSVFKVWNRGSSLSLPRQ